MRALSRDNRVNVYKRLSFVLVLIFVVVFDQITKSLAEHYLLTIKSYKLWDGVFHLTYCKNEGAAFSMLSGHRWIFITITVVAITIMLIAVLLMKKAGYMFFISLGMIVGGGVGNMIDRIFNGYVVDFFDFALINFAIFNVADIFITLGTVFLLTDIIFLEKEDFFNLGIKKKTEQSAEKSAEESEEKSAEKQEDE